MSKKKSNILNNIESNNILSILRNSYLSIIRISELNFDYVSNIFEIRMETTTVFHRQVYEIHIRPIVQSRIHIGLCMVYGICITLGKWHSNIATAVTSPIGSNTMIFIRIRIVC